MLLRQSKDDLLDADVDRDYEAGKNVAAERQCNGQVKARSATNLRFAKLTEDECVPAKLHRNSLSRPKTLDLHVLMITRSFLMTIVRKTIHEAAWKPGNCHKESTLPR